MEVQPGHANRDLGTRGWPGLERGGEMPVNSQRRRDGAKGQETCGVATCNGAPTIRSRQPNWSSSGVHIGPSQLDSRPRVPPSNLN